jgi:hypothetical protein
VLKLIGNCVSPESALPIPIVFLSHVAFADQVHRSQHQFIGSITQPVPDAL